jgi:hypothetical protein
MVPHSQNTAKAKEWDREGGTIQHEIGKYFTRVSLQANPKT